MASAVGGVLFPVVDSAADWRVFAACVSLVVNESDHFVLLVRKVVKAGDLTKVVFKQINQSINKCINE